MDKHIFDAEREIDGHRFNPSAVMGAVLGLVVATASMAYAVPAYAADPSDPQATSKDDGLNEIVVTANRRSENIQKVPIAVTAISSSAMDEFSIKRPEDLAKVVPGLAAIPNAGTAVFIGVDLVSNAQTRAPDPAAGLSLVNRLRDKNVLISASGPFGHVLKIRPPLPFSCANADEFLGKLAEALHERRQRV
jgi:hypothetical protein